MKNDKGMAGYKLTLMATNALISEACDAGIVKLAGGSWKQLELDSESLT